MAESKAKALRKELSFEYPHIAKVAPEQISKAQEFAEGYKKFLDKSKTEREVVKEAVSLLEANGYTVFDPKKSYKAGDKIYKVNRKKAILASTIGSEPITEGIRINGAHIDSPRLDLRPNPLYEKSEISYFKTHYYGGIRKYQWATIPLSMHGVIFRKDGSFVEINLGEKEEDPVFYISDLLPHLSSKQDQRKLSEGIKGEELNIFLGTLPFDDTDDVKEAVKLKTLEILNNMYGVTERDFARAEIEFVPATKARDIGLDRSLVGGYGHDDRVCAYTTLKAILEVESPKRTAAALFADKEEIGSVGNTGMQALYFENMVAEIAALNKNYRDIDVRRAFANSYMLSADVSAGFDPAFPSVFEKMNSAYVGNGICINKYTGSGGKGGSNDANAEFLQRVRKIFDDNKVVWQTAELGKIDAGGGGTIAYIIAKYGAEVVDCGVPVLSMHAPFEILSKADLYMAYKAYRAFYK